MPPGPQLLDAGRKKRLAEVFRQVQAQDLAHAQHNIRVAGKIGIQLERIHNRGKNQLTAVKGRRVRKGGADHNGRTVRNGKLFEIPPRTALQTADQTLGFKRFGGGFQLGHQGIIAVERPLGEREEKARIAPQPCIAGRGCCTAMPHIQQVARQLQAVIRKAKGLIQIPQARHQHAAVFEHQQRQQGCGQPQCQPPAAAGLLWLRMLRGLPHHCRGKGYRKKRADINGKAEHCVGCQNQLPAGRLGHAVPQADKQRHKRQKAKGCNRKHQLPSPCCTVLSGDVASFSATVS